jgi:hypothetical protein
MYVCDGSVIAANLGVNPSLTICALTERAMSYIQPVAKTKWNDAPRAVSEAKGSRGLRPDKPGRDRLSPMIRVALVCQRQADDAPPAHYRMDPAALAERNLCRVDHRGHRAAGGGMRPKRICHLQVEDGNPGRTSRSVHPWADSRRSPRRTPRSRRNWATRLDRSDSSAKLSLTSVPVSSTTHKAGRVLPAAMTSK